MQAGQALVRTLIGAAFLPPNVLNPSLAAPGAGLPSTLVEPELVRLAPFGPIGLVSSWKPALRHLPATGSQLQEKEKNINQQFMCGVGLQNVQGCIAGITDTMPDAAVVVLLWRVGILRRRTNGGTPVTRVEWRIVQGIAGGVANAMVQEVGLLAGDAGTDLCLWRIR